MAETPLLYVLRHGETESNAARRFAGWSDDPVNETGRKQAEALAERLAPEGVRHVFSSPVRRATETARVLTDRLDATVRTVHDLHEIDVGPWKGLTHEEVEERWPEAYARWKEDPAGFELDGREALERVRDRALSALNQIGRSLMGEDDASAAVVTHLALIRVLWLTATGGALSDYHEVEGPFCEPFPIRWLGRGRIEAAGPAPEPPAGGARPRFE